MILAALPLLANGQCPNITSRSNAGTYGSTQIVFELDSAYWTNCNGSNIDIVYNSPYSGCYQENWFQTKKKCGSGKEKLIYNGCDFTYCRDSWGDTIKTIVVQIEQAVPYRKAVCEYAIIAGNYSSDPKSASYCTYILDSPMYSKGASFYCYRDGCFVVCEYSHTYSGSLLIESSSDGEHFDDTSYLLLEGDSKGKFAFVECGEVYVRASFDFGGKSIFRTKVSLLEKSSEQSPYWFYNTINCQGCKWGSIRIYSIGGAVVYSGSFSDYFDYSFLNDGIYIAVLENESQSVALKIAKID